MQQFRPQVGECRFRSLVTIATGRLQAVTAGAGRDVDERLVQAVLPKEPSVGPAKSGQILLLAEQAERGERGVGHGGGLHRLLIVR